jgi:hypothetical protein
MKYKRCPNGVNVQGWCGLFVGLGVYVSRWLRHCLRRTCKLTAVVPVAFECARTRPLCANTHEL